MIFGGWPRTSIDYIPKNPPPLAEGFYLISNTLSWRLATFPKRVSSPLLCLTSLFGMGRGVTTALNHQDKKFDKRRSAEQSGSHLIVQSENDESLLPPCPTHT